MQSLRQHGEGRGFDELTIDSQGKSSGQRKYTLQEAQRKTDERGDQGGGGGGESGIHEKFNFSKILSKLRCGMLPLTTIEAE